MVLLSRVQEKEEQHALIARCKMDGIFIASTENSLQFPINAVLDVVKPFIRIDQIEKIKNGLKKLLATLTSKRYSQGMVKGYPDLFVPEYKLYIELKRRDGGVCSQEQLEVHEQLRSFGYKVEVCHGAKAAWEVIERERSNGNNN